MRADSSRRTKLAIAFAIVYLVWGSTYLVASIGVHAMPPVLFGGIRFICAGILLGITALALGRKFRARRHRVAPPADRRGRQRGDPERLHQLGDAVRGVQPDRDPQCLGGAVDRAVRDARAARASRSTGARSSASSSASPAPRSSSGRAAGSKTSHFGMQLLILLARVRLVGDHRLHPQRRIRSSTCCRSPRCRCCWAA